MRVALTGGAYRDRSIIASAQRCINLYPEDNSSDSQAPVSVTHYPTPGLTVLGTSPNIAKVRQTYRATNGDLYVCVGPQVYYIDNTFTFNLLGTILDAQTPVYFSDNGLVIVLVDGTLTGYAIDMITRQFGQIIDPNFLGSTRVDFIDTYFIFNQPGTANLYISLSEVTFPLLAQTAISDGTIVGGSLYTTGLYTGVTLTGGSGTGATANISVSGGVVNSVDITNGGKGYLVGNILTTPSANIGGTGSGFTFTVTAFAPAFDPLDIAAKAGSADPIQVVVVVHREAWPIGTLTAETWYDSGAADFPLQALPGAFVEHGCVAPYSVALNDNNAFWLHQDRQGNALVIKTQGYQAIRISTHAIEAEFQSYPTITDAIGYTFQQEGHIFYVLVFPSADKTWAVDLQSLQWFEWASIDGNGVLHRHRSNCSCFAYGKNIVGDWQNGNLYDLDPDAYTDNGVSIPRIRSFPHLLNDLKRVTYTQFIADMQVGTILVQTVPDDPMISLRWSDTRGVSYGNSVEQSLGNTGEYLTSISWWRLGMARDRVFELSWSAPMKTALNGAFIELKQHKT